MKRVPFETIEDYLENKDTFRTIMDLTKGKK